MLDTPRTWRYQSAVLLGPRPKLPDQPNGGPEEGWGAPFELSKSWSLARVVSNGAGARRGKRRLLTLNLRPSEISSSPYLARVLMQAHGSQQVSLRAPRLIPGSAGSVRGFAGVAQLVEHLFCKQVVSGSIPLASSGGGTVGAPQFTLLVKASEGCPS